MVATFRSIGFPPVSDSDDRFLPENMPSALLSGAHLAGLWTLGIVQPLLSLLGSNPDFFVARDNSASEIIVFALLLTFLPPLAATAVEALLNPVSRKARWGIHLVLIALLFSIVVLQFMKQVVDAPALPMIVISLMGGVFLARAYGYGKFMRSLTDILTVAPVVVLVSFFFFSDTSELTTSTSEVTALDVKVGNPAPVVMMVFDEFPVASLMTPEGEINRKRFPGFTELQSQSNWYRNTMVSGSYTAIAVPSILSGKEADRELLPIAADYPESVFTLLGGSYKVHAVEPITHLCPPSICPEEDESRPGFGDALSSLVSDLKYVSGHLILPDSMGSSLPDISQSFGGFGHETPNDSIEKTRASQFVIDQLKEEGPSLDGQDDFDQFLSKIDPEADSTFDFVHVTEPHYPWTHFPDGTRYTDTTEDFRGFITATDWLAGPYLTNRARQAQLLETGFADHLLGTLIDRLKRDGKWNKSLVVVVADHGGAMTKGMNRREAEPETMGEIASVPLFIKSPGQTNGRIVDRPTCTSETLELMAKALDTEVPWGAPLCSRSEVSIDNGAGPLVRSPAATVVAQRDDAADNLASIFGADTGWASVLKLGPNKNLIGRDVASLPVKATQVDQGARSENDTTSYASGDGISTVLRQRGVLSGVATGSPLAVAVNGRIAAVGESYEEGSDVRYSILLPRRFMREGNNEVTVYRAQGAGEGIWLSTLWSSY